MSENPSPKMRALLAEAAAMALSYAAVADADPYAGRDPNRHEPRNGDAARDLARRIDEVIGGRDEVEFSPAMIQGGGK